jgi:hypothetical protein
MKIDNYIYYHQHIGVEVVSFESQSSASGAQRSANRLLLSAFTPHPLTFHPLTLRLVLFVFIHFPGSVVINSIPFLGQRPGWDFLLFFRGVASRHDGRGAEAFIHGMTRPFRAGRELPC